MTKEKRLTHSLWAKVVAIFLMVIMAFVAFACVFEFCIAYDYGYYTDVHISAEDSSFYQSAIYNGVSDEMALRLFGITYGLRYWCIAIGALCVLLFFACLVFLCVSAGHKGETDEIFLNPMDRLPMDLYAAAAGLLVFLLLSLAIESVYFSYLFSYILFFAVITFSGLIVLAVFLSVVTRAKYGRWWENTLIYRAVLLAIRVIKWIWAGSKVLWRKIRNGCAGVFHAVPLVWRTALVVIVVLFVNLFLAIESTWSGLWLILWAVLNFSIFASMCFGALQMRRLKEAGEKLAAGEIDYKLDTSRMFWDFKCHGDKLNSIGDGMAKVVNQRMKSERLKTELITNVSHDIKTPLTSIINYVDLLQKEHTKEQEQEYLDVLDRQSNRLKKLTEDLVEASKASTGNMSVNLARTNTVEIINQSLGEYSERIGAAKLHVITNAPEQPIFVLADGRLLWRVMDNLFNNVCKYALPDTRVYVDVTAGGDEVGISIKNISRSALNISADELTERFVRGDSARSTEGSGLGLNIAKSLVELQKGRFEVTTDGDLFKAVIHLPEA